jgi:hypothetical protein
MGRIQGRNEGSVVVVVVVGICNILSVFDRKLKNFGFCRLKLKKNKKLLSVKLVFFISTPPPLHVFAVRYGPARIHSNQSIHSNQHEV